MHETVQILAKVLMFNIRKGKNFNRGIVVCGLNILIPCDVHTLNNLYTQSFQKQKQQQKNQ